jgi:hypothetical protein
MIRRHACTDLHKEITHWSSLHSMALHHRLLEQQLLEGRRIPIAQTVAPRPRQMVPPPILSPVPVPPTISPQRTRSPERPPEPYLRESPITPNEALQQLQLGDPEWEPRRNAPSATPISPRKQTPVEHLVTPPPVATTPRSFLTPRQSRPSTPRASVSGLSARDRVLQEISAQRARSPGSSAFRSTSPRFGLQSSVSPKVAAQVLDRGFYIRPMFSTSHDFYVPPGMADNMLNNNKRTSPMRSRVPRFGLLVPHAGMTCPMVGTNSPRAGRPTKQ